MNRSNVVWMQARRDLKAGQVVTTDDVHPIPARWSCGHRRGALVGSPYIPCPACGEMMRRNRAHWAALFLVVLVVLFIACAAAVGSR
jgi:hypothetical protein